jgi:hypothetical protein
MLIFPFLASDSVVEAHYFIFDNFGNIENVDDGGFVVIAPAFSGCLSPQGE